MRKLFIQLSSLLFLPLHPRLLPPFLHDPRPLSYRFRVVVRLLRCKEEGGRDGTEGGREGRHWQALAGRQEGGLRDYLGSAIKTPHSVVRIPRKNELPSM